VPELPEVEVLVRHLTPLLNGLTIDSVFVSRPRVSAPTSREALKKALAGAMFLDVTRRGKYLVFVLRGRRSSKPFQVLGHLGMTGRMYLQRPDELLPKHAAVVLGLGGNRFVFEDTRYFGRFTLDTSPLAELGPEPLSESFSPGYLQTALSRSAQPIKQKLLDQTVVAGIGNIYASEALFRAGISPRLPAQKISSAQADLLWQSIGVVLDEAIQTGSSLTLNFGNDDGDGLFYFGGKPGAEPEGGERFRVYDRAGQPCTNCGRTILRVIQAGRSTFYCPACQRNRPKMSRKVSNSN
jgi:formamidopyrimidine-DNA glycosylase